MCDESWTDIDTPLPTNNDANSFWTIANAATTTSSNNSNSNAAAATAATTGSTTGPATDPAQSGLTNNTLKWGPPWLYHQTVSVNIECLVCVCSAWLMSLIELFFLDGCNFRSDTLKVLSPTVADAKIVELAETFENVIYQRSPNKVSSFDYPRTELHSRGP